ncbi:MAG TPA: amylo-alpha-1,6-glucosidase [Thermoanaerobaculia bacterium]|nr:amylo-alpha-1,6-glucosidase [Thermoanaerobaculia bacterium]
MSQRPGPASLPARGASKPLEWSARELEGRASKLEWLETDGLGGFACGTVSGARTRRYHGWYLPAIPAPRRRWMLVSGADEFVTAGGVTEGISTQAYRDATHPNGARSIARFRLEPFPSWLHQTAAFSLERSICLVRERSLTIVRYVNRGASELTLRVRPLLAFRGSHRLQTETTDWDTATEVRGEVSWVRPLPYLPRLYLRGVFAATRVEPVWYRHFAYAEEERRGYDATEDLWSPLEWEWTLRPDARAFLLFSLDEVAADPEHFMDEERVRRQSFARTRDSVFDELSRRAEVFVADADHRRATVLAGYPWLADWGRQAMVAAPGLAQATGRAGAVARVLNTFAGLRRDGLIPNHFSREEGEPEYDSVDASLWFILAADWFGRARRNPLAPSPLLGAVRSIIEAYRRGTRFGIGVGPDGLLAGDAPGRALTWMDAVVDDKPVTPRAGRAVEVNALWHAALKSAARLERLSDEAGRARELESEAWHVARRFNETFWNGARSALHDVVGDGGPDESLRPNQILAVSLTEDLLPPHRARAVYWTVRRELLTPFGLRTLEPADPRYRGRADGDERERLLAAHQGAVWPWLLGPFADAHFRVFGHGEESRRTMRVLLAPLRAHVLDAGLGSISEMFDGDPPHAPRGCFAQAWSVAEVARIVYTHLLGED